MRHGGTIVLTTSMAAHNGIPGHAAHNAAKASLRSLPHAADLVVDGGMSQV